MRLTLRTLLAFMDGQLKPEDAIQLGERIKNSERAQQLKSHIELLRSRNNLSAPKIDIQGLGDANLVAQYLDSTLDPEQVAAFEKLCLESDIQLAEVSESHQMLISTKKSETVSPELRQKIYSIANSQGTEAESPAVSHSKIDEYYVDSADEQVIYHTDVFALAPPSREYASDEEMPAASLPDKPPAESKGRKPSPALQLNLIPILATLASLLLLTFLIVWATRDSSPNQVSQLTKPEAESNDQKNLSTSHSVPQEIKTVNGSSASFLQNKNEKNPIKDSHATFVETPVEKVEQTPKENTEEVSQPKPVQPPAKIDEDVTLAPVKNDADPADEKVVEANFTNDLNPEPNLKPVPEVTQPETSGITKRFDLRDIPIGAASATLLEDGEYLAKLGPNKDWVAVTPGDQLKENDILLALPFYQPTLLFANKQMTVIGPGTLSIMPVNEKGTPGVALTTGRYIFRTEDEAFDEIQIRAGDIDGTLTLHDSTSTIAIEISRDFPNGIDPGKFFEQRQTTVTITCISGRSTWVDQRDVTKLKEKQARVYQTGVESKVDRVDDLPSWMKGKLANEFEDADRELLVKASDQQTNLTSVLKSILASDEIEETTRGKLLVEMCLLYMGDSSRLMQILSRNSPVYNRLWVWRSAIQFARENLSRSKLNAKEFQEQLSADKEGLNALRILYRFSDDQLEIGADEILVKLLGHDNQALRVIAHQELWDITGESKLFRPETVERLRMRQIESWKRSLAKKEIRYLVE